MSKLEKITPEQRGHLHMKGSLCAKPAANKYEKYWFLLKDAVLAWYVLEATPGEKDKKKPKSTKSHDTEMQGKLVELLPLTYAVLEDEPISKKEKPPSNFAFAISDVNNKKFRTSFCAESEQDLKAWKKHLSESINLARSAIFDTTINDACLKSNKYLPRVIDLCIAEIDKNLRVEGLFRVPGDQNQITAARATFDNGLDPNFEGADPHMVCGLMKWYLRELTEPLLPAHMYKSFLSASTIEEFKKLIEEIPETNRSCLCYTMQFLKRVEQESQHNLMDVNNLGTVFGPTIVRNPEAEKTQAKTSGLEEMAQANHVIKMLIQNTDTLFTIEDMERCKRVIFNVEKEISRTRHNMMTPAEQAAVEAVILPHHNIAKLAGKETVWDSAMGLLVNIKNLKTKLLEPRIFVADRNRVYIFLRGGKIEYEFHLIDLLEVESSSKAQVTLTWTTLPGSGKNTSVTVCPISYGSFDMDTIIDWISRTWDQNFIGTPESNKFKLTVGPPERKEQIYSRFSVEDTEPGCGGLTRTYVSVCDYKNTPVQEAVLWDLDNYFYPNQIKMFNLYDILHKDKYPNPEFETMIFSLRYNTWFTALDCAECALGNDAVVMIADAFKTNGTIESLSLKNAGASHKGITALCDAFAANPAVNITNLDLSGNTIDIKTSTSLCTAVCNTLGKLTTLDLSNAQIKKLAPILEALGRTVSLMNSSLKSLTLSHNSLDVESSRLMGIILCLSKGLTKLGLSGTSPTWLSMAEGMMDGASPKQNTTLTELDISHNPTKQKQQSDIVRLTTNLPNVININLADMSLTSETLMQIIAVNSAVVELDISENDLTDDGIVDVMKAMSSAITSQLKLKKLKMNKVFNKRTKSRQSAMRNISKALTYAQIKELSLEGSKLKEDLVDILLGLLTNTTLEVLNISDNQGGDTMAETLAKVFQHNNSLRTVFWDGNEVTISGLKSIKLGLQRNKSITHMPLPLLDVADILKKADVDQQAVVKLADDIQNIIYKIASASREAALEPDSSSSIPTLFLPPGTFQAPERTARRIPLTPSTEKMLAASPKKHQRKKPSGSAAPYIDMAKASRLFGVRTEGSEVSLDTSQDPSPRSSFDQPRVGGLQQTGVPVPATPHAGGLPNTTSSKSEDGTDETESNSEQPTARDGNVLPSSRAAARKKKSSKRDNSTKKTEKTEKERGLKSSASLQVVPTGGSSHVPTVVSNPAVATTEEGDNAAESNAS